MVPAVEILVNTARVKELIADPKRTREIHDAIATGRDPYGMVSFDQCLTELVQRKLVTYAEASSQRHQRRRLRPALPGRQQGRLGRDAARPARPAHRPPSSPPGRHRRRRQARGRRPRVPDRSLQGMDRPSRRHGGWAPRPDSGRRKCRKALVFPARCRPKSSHVQGGAAYLPRLLRGRRATRRCRARRWCPPTTPPCCSPTRG